MLTLFRNTIQYVLINTTFTCYLLFCLRNKFNETIFPWFSAVNYVWFHEWMQCLMFNFNRSRSVFVSTYFTWPFKNPTVLNRSFLKDSGSLLGNIAFLNFSRNKSMMKQGMWQDSTILLKWHFIQTNFIYFSLQKSLSID